MIRQFWEQAWLSYKSNRIQFNFEEYILLEIMYPLVTLIFYCIVATYSFQTTNIENWVIGNAFLMCVNASIFGVGSAFVEDRYYGRLSGIIIAPINKFTIIVERGIFSCFETILVVILGLILGCMIFKVDFSEVDLFMMALIIIVAMMSTTCFGLLLATVGVLTDEMNFLLNFVYYILLIFSGAEFPIKQLPLFGRLISKCIPLTNSIEAANILVSNKDANIFYLLFNETLLAYIYICTSVIVLKIAEKIAIKYATIDIN